ncbi:glycosyltransferase 87 family protein [Actinoplanes sp. NPDC051633]|uniref:glycosyltransferase 87 family protein n=1 Tax=Actinoplanes sp. NPDC051633 TaxID=3155670 RepID=UPI0034479C28
MSSRRSIVVAAGAAAALAAVAFFIHGYALSGLALDRGAIRGWLSGDGLYAYRDPISHLGPDLPPPAAHAFVPIAFLPLTLVGWLLALAGLAALTLAMVALAAPVARRYGQRTYPLVLIAVLLALATEPVRAAIGLGERDLIAFGLVVADIVALRRSAWTRSRAAWWPGGSSSRGLWATGGWAGAGIGLATVLTVGPGLFILYLALTKQWRAALTAVTTAGTLAVSALLLAPRETAAWFGEVFLSLDRTGGVDRTGNQSLAGVLARLYDSETTPILLWLSFAMLLVAVGFIRARSAHSDGDEIAAFTLIGLTGAIVGPVTGTHELIWVLPAVLILLDSAARRRLTARRPLPGQGHRYPGLGLGIAGLATYLLFLIAPVWTFDDALLRNSYALGLILLVNALPWRSGVAPAFPINRWLDRRRPVAARAIPPARRPMGS